MGGVPYSVLEPVLERCTPDQLYRIEEYNHVSILFGTGKAIFWPVSPELASPPSLQWVKGRQQWWFHCSGQAGLPAGNMHIFSTCSWHPIKKGFKRSRETLPTLPLLSHRGQGRIWAAQPWEPGQGQSFVNQGQASGEYKSTGTPGASVG